MAKKVKDMHRLKTLSPVEEVGPFIMPNRTGSMNFFKDYVDCERLEKYIKEKKAEGMKNISPMHVMIAAQIRLISQRPALNRFIRGQRIWSRKSIEIAMTIKKEMKLDSPDTVIKVRFMPGDTINDVYEKMTDAIEGYRNDPGGDFDKTAKALTRFPSLLLKLVVHTLKTLDYFGLVPKFLTDLSPFHCSYYITSMASLAIPPIYHHLYDFGTCPLFFSFGTKRHENELADDGTVKKRSYIDFTYTMDERIVDGYYFASCLRIFKSILKNPWQLDEPVEVVDDID